MSGVFGREAFRSLVDRRRRWSILALFTAVALVFALSGVPGRSAAWADPSPQPSPVGAASIDGSQLTVEYILSVNPRAKVIRPNVVEVGPGVAVLLPAQGPVPLSASYCDLYWLCVWEHSYGQAFGAGLAFLKCSASNQAVDLMSLQYPDGTDVGRGSGPRWHDRISSYSNNQSSGTHSWFANWVGSTLTVVRNSFAPDYYADLYYVGINDIIDAVHVCG